VRRTIDGVRDGDGNLTEAADGTLDTVVTFTTDCRE
jgi:hypothetical protein